jgi:hypothetical protein
MLDGLTFHLRHAFHQNNQTYSLLHFILTFEIYYVVRMSQNGIARICNLNVQKIFWCTYFNLFIQTTKSVR